MAVYGYKKTDKGLDLQEKILRETRKNAPVQIVYIVSTTQGSRKTETDNLKHLLSNTMPHGGFYVCARMS